MAQGQYIMQEKLDIFSNFKRIICPALGRDGVMPLEYFYGLSALRRWHVPSPEKRSLLEAMMPMIGRTGIHSVDKKDDGALLNLEVAGR